MFNVYWLNFDYFCDQDFASFDDAVAYAKSKCFEAVIIKPYRKGHPYQGGEHVGFWSPIGGLQDRRAV